jgi:transposase
VTFKVWLEHAKTLVLAKSPTGQALKYIAKYWTGLILFLTNGRIEMDSNAAERTIRPIALQKRTRSSQATTLAHKTAQCSRC